MALDDLASKLADLRAELGNAKIQQMAQQPRQQQQLQGLMQLVDDLMADDDQLKGSGQQDEQRIMNLEARLASIEAMQSGSSNDLGRETAEIKQIRKNVAGYAEAMGRGTVDPVTSAQAFPPDATTKLDADPLSPQEVPPGQLVSLRGKNMQRVTEVRVDGDPALIVSMTEQKLEFMVPSDIDQPKAGSKPKELDVEVFVGKKEISGGLTVCIEPATQQSAGMSSVGGKQTGGS